MAKVRLSQGQVGPAMHATFEKTSVFAERRAIAVLAPIPSVGGARAREWHGRGPYGPGCAVSPRVLVCKVLLSRERTMILAPTAFVRVADASDAGPELVLAHAAAVVRHRDG